MKKFFKSYFSFTRRETFGIIFLLFIIASLILILFFLKNGQEVIPFDYSSYEEDIRLFENQIKSNAEKELNNTNKPEISEVNNSTLFYFNPNTIDSISWLALGFSPKQVKSILNFKRKGGKFYSKNDVAKMYVIDSAAFLRIEPFIVIPESKNNNFSERRFNKTPDIKTNKNKTYVNINTADSVQLISIKGIGPVFSSRIIKLRNKLGGFVNKNQLSEVYGLKPEIIEQIDEHIYIEQNYIPQKININSASYQILKEHPYIDYSIAKVIVSYRNQHGKYKNIEDVKKIHLVTEDLYSKIAPYLSVE